MEVFTSEYLQTECGQPVTMMPDGMTALIHTGVIGGVEVTLVK
jgi:hypothetical protein